VNRSTGSVFPSFPRSSGGNPLSPPPLDAGLETAGMTGVGTSGSWAACRNARQTFRASSFTGEVRADTPPGDLSLTVTSALI